MKGFKKGGLTDKAGFINDFGNSERGSEKQVTYIIKTAGANEFCGTLFAGVVQFAV